MGFWKQLMIFPGKLGSDHSFSFGTPVLVSDDMGSPFDARPIDLNGDGKTDLLATNHVPVANQSAVFAFIQTANGQFTKQILATNFPTLAKGKGQASPGAAIPFWPTTAHADTPPWIVLAVDGNEAAYVLQPSNINGGDENENEKNKNKNKNKNARKVDMVAKLEYTVHKIAQYNGVVGQPAVGDFDGDGCADIAVPDYGHGIVHVYTYGN